MFLKKDTIVYSNEIGHNNMSYPNKSMYFMLQNDCIVEPLSLLNSEGYIAIKFFNINLPNLYWVKKI